MIKVNRIFYAVLFSCFLLILAENINACSCAPKQTVLDAFENAENVVIAKAVSIEKGVLKLTVEKVFKGKLKAGSEMIVLSGGGMCAWSFSEKSIGEKYLFYKGELASIGGCGRSTNLKFAADDLLYLENLPKVRGRTRVSGEIRFSQNSPLEDGESIDKVLENIRVQIIGKNRTFVTKTDKNGIYEIYDLPPGEYTVKPLLPKTMKIDYIYSDSSSEDGMDEDEYDSYKAAQRLFLRAEKHAYFNFTVRTNNIIRGKIYDALGGEMNGVCLKLVPAYGKISKYFYEVECTEKEGKFEFDKIPSGSYYLVGNDDGKISSEEPLGTFYYPGVIEREKAAVITLGEGDFREGVDIHIPSMAETVTVEGVFLYSDGKPVAEEYIQFKAENAPENIEGDARAETDSKGRFSIKILKGLKGKLFGSMYTYLGEFENCPKLEELIRANTKNTSYEPKTPELEISADNNIYGVELKFTFPGCKRAED